MNDNYRRRAEKYTLLSNKISRVISLIVGLKFAVIVAAIVQATFMYKMDQYLPGGIVLFIFLVVYVYLDKKHYSLLEVKNTADILTDINNNAVKRFNGRWTDFEDTGYDLIPPDHPYCVDLDILGEGSLFQWFNMCATPWGRKSLARALLFPGKDIAEISSRQKAVDELSSKVAFRHRLKAEGIKADAGEKEFRELIKWAQTAHPFFRKGPVIFISRSFPVLTLTALLAATVFNTIPLFLSLIMITIQGFLLFVHRRELRKLESVNRCHRSLVKLEAVFALIEGQNFQSPLLQSLQAKMSNEQNSPPVKQIKRLARLASSVSNRSHMLYFVINLFLLWDFQLYIALEKWKCESGKKLYTWFEILGEFEELSSLALIRYDHPAWAVPKFESETSPVIIGAVQVGHPLLADCVPNDIRFTQSSPIILITGSNMSGKSTFLRTIGVNLVLAYTGAPVYAASFSCQCLDLFTCMRIADNLQKNISSFYAEILRIKMIVEQVQKSHVFFLLDELFKGTNSADRHTAAKTIVNYLNQKGAAGMISTHDLDLAVLEEESGARIRNCHFRESYSGGRICFDYKLRPGVSDTRNAIFLLKASGIDAFEQT